MKFGVIIFPGSNCDQDMVHVIREVMGQEVVEIFHKEKNLEGFTESDCIILPGGFSFGDYLRSGAIASHSPIMGAIKTFAEKGGKVWGICNGFQILCESGLLPGGLLYNTNEKYICKNVHLTPGTSKSLLTNEIPQGKVLKIPIAHAEGRFIIDDDGYQKLVDQDQILFRYCDASGVINEESNPNGSRDNIAGICNQGRNVFGMMPHPERASEDVLGNQDGKYLFQSLLKNVKELSSI